MRSSPAGVCLCGHGPAVHPGEWACQLSAGCGCAAWTAAPARRPGEHSCQLSDDAEAQACNLALFGRWSGDRGRIYPIDTRVKALHLLERHREANDLARHAQMLIPKQTLLDAATHRRLAHIQFLHDQINNRGGR